ncbi:nitronate monooxygenase [Sphingobacterium sp. SRCM116780]|uniref:NAD(P)H-dependent flavin oxidoreductase n=1 Tax=Sphingobacterium sp. SRCM116780 TaxID=2907623 RepID=UPI001F4802B6|nr:nitronate monooxygenase [Sphingobacterium sp. SRCM116780]UIR57353.1 nitronate monooxygenase [Sphingobacterium sp. SRCM116780]
MKNKQWANELSRVLRVNYPIVQAPMLGVSTPEMVAASAEAHILGSLALGDLPAASCRELIRKTKSLTYQPFATNIFVHDIPTVSEELKLHYSKTKRFIEVLARQHQLHVELPDLEEIKLTDYHDQVDVLISEHCPIVSFTFGMPDVQSVQKLKENGTLLIGTATSVAEAKQLEILGMDSICVQGFEAGGHRGSFVQDDIPRIGGISLLAHIYDSVSVPLIYAGGIYNAKTLLAAKALGAQGFQVGSLLLCSTESELQAFEKRRLQNVQEHDIILTKSFSGRYARGIRNIFTENLDNSTHILPYPYQNKLTAELRKVAKQHQNTDFVNLWVGQSLHAFSEASTVDIIEQLIKEVETSHDL